MDLKELELGVNPDVHWYYQSKTLPLDSLYPQGPRIDPDPVTIVDVGSGSGFFRHHARKEVWRPDKEGLSRRPVLYREKRSRPRKDRRSKRCISIPEKIENGLVILMDVLEHLEDDLKMLNEIKAACVGTNNYFFITVPAFYSLWSGHDVYLGHYRRYKIDTLSAVLNKAHFNIKNTYYLYGSLFPMVWLARKVSNMKKERGQHQYEAFQPRSE
jgi:hypothetical protein